MKILAIGNSFSEDATAYLYQIGKAGGKNLKVVNLYIGGCSLERHWKNVEVDIRDYDYQLNGNHTDGKISIKEALMEEKWDVVTLQQCSGQSGLKESYYPYIEKLSEYVTSLVPGAKQWIHKTWALHHLFLVELCLCWHLLRYNLVLKEVLLQDYFDNHYNDFPFHSHFL